MKNFFKFLGIISLILVIGFSMAGCKPDDDESEDTNGDGTTPGGTTPGGTTPVAAEVGDLAGRYFKTSADATSNLDTNRQFEITDKGHLESYTGIALTRDFIITSKADGKLSLTYVPKYGTGNHPATVDYEYDADAKTLKVSNPQTTSDLGVGGVFMGNFDARPDENDEARVYFKH
jgi:hypothetical protein